jgi:hypothetical protein
MIPTCLLCLTAAALADELPTRKAGLWELKMEFEGHRIPIQSMQQCTDAAADKQMTSGFGNGSAEACPDRHITKSGGTITVDSVCDIAGAKVTSHAVISGQFDSAYTVNVTTKREGGRPLPHVAPGGVSHMTMQAKWLGPCAKDQRPGDVIMPGGMKINILDIGAMPGGRPHRP